MGVDNYSYTKKCSFKFVTKLFLKNQKQKLNKELFYQKDFFQIDPSILNI